MIEPLTPRESFGVLFVGVSRRWRAAIDSRLSDVGLSDATWRPLIHIGRGRGLCQKDLATRLGIDGSTLVRLLDILSKKELIERRQDKTDRRSNLLYLTPAGRKVVHAIQEALAAVEGDMLQDLSDDEMRGLMSALERIDARIGTIRSRTEDAETKRVETLSAQ